ALEQAQYRRRVALGGQYLQVFVRTGAHGSSNLTKPEAMRSGRNPLAISRERAGQAPRSSGARSARTTASRNAATSPAGTTSPASNACTQSAMPAPSLVTEGVPTAAAST